MNTQSNIFDGNIKKTLLKLSLPILAGMVFDLFYNLTDTWFLSLIDKNDTSVVAGVGLVFPVYFVLIALTHGFFMGVTTLVAVAVGKGQSDFRKTTASAFWLAILVSLPLIVAMSLWGESVIKLLAGKALTEKAIQHGTEYIRWIFLGSFFFMVSHAFIGVLQGKGKTMNVGMAMLISTILNIILDPIFIFVLDMGVKGAAIATVLSQISIFIYAIWIQLSDKDFRLSDLKLKWIDKREVKEIVHLGLPQSMGLATLGLSVVLLNWLVSSIGETEMNAFTLVGRIDNLLITPILAFSFSLSTMIGQNYGKGNHDRTLKILKEGTKLTLLVVVALSVVYIFIAPFLFKIFTHVNSVLSISVAQVRWVTLFFGIGATLEIFAGAAFQSIKQPMKAFWATCMRMGVISWPLAYLLVFFISKRIEWIWVAVSVGNLAGGIICYTWALHFYRKKLTIST